MQKDLPKTAGRKNSRYAIPTNDIMKTKNLTSLAIISVLAMSAPIAFSQDSTTKTEEKGAAKIESDSLTKLIADSATFSILTQALKAAELDVTLGTKGAYTIFAPTDEAFGKLPAGSLEKLLLPENKEKLRSLLLYHVIPGQLLSVDLKDGDVKTMNGEKVEIDVDGDKIELDDSKVFSVDVVASNGVMHSIGEVVVPKSLDGFAGLKD